MKTAMFPVGNNMCESCALALRRFIGGLDGVASIDTLQGQVVVTYDDSAIPEETVDRLTRESIEKLGYSVKE